MLTLFYFVFPDWLKIHDFHMTSIKWIKLAPPMCMSCTLYKQREDGVNTLRKFSWFWSKAHSSNQMRLKESQLSITNQISGELHLISLSSRMRATETFMNDLKVYKHNVQFLTSSANVFKCWRKWQGHCLKDQEWVTVNQGFYTQQKHGTIIFRKNATI